MFSYPTPFTPPTTEDDRLSWLRLIRSRRVGVTTFWRLLSEHGSARAALLALPELARASGMHDYQPCPEGVVLAEVKAARRVGARMICRGEASYPLSLGQIADPPPVLWARGDVKHLMRPMVAMVGARNASSLGTRMARKLAGDLSAAGLTVVSGLARGIDAVAHLAALDGGTIAVMAGGVDVIYPAENLGLADQILAKGVLLSEQPISLAPQARHFPQRNRIIAGLSRAVVVVEAAAQSGSLTTAKMALDQGRDVLVVPGHPFDARAAGCNMLIRDGATLVRGAEDVLAVLSLTDNLHKAAAPAQSILPMAAPTATAPVAPRNWKDQGALHSLILNRLGPSPLAEDQLLRDLAVSPADAAPELLTLELDGKIIRAPGGLLSRA